MAGLYKRGKTYWYQLHGERKSTKCTDKDAAALVYARAQQRYADPTYAAADEATLADWSKRMLEAKASGKAAGTSNMYACKAGHVVRVFGEGARLAEITPESVDAYVATRQKEGASNSTIGKELTAILQICKLAKRSGAYSGDTSVLRPPDFSIDYEPREATLSATDEKKLRLACTPAEWGAVALILGTGCRLSEAFRVRPADLDWERREVRIRGTKTAAAAALIPIVERCGMAAYLKEAEPHLPITWAQMSKRLPERCEAAQIARITPNDLRRTVATRLIESGVDAYTVAKITRHATLGMLKRVYDKSNVAATRELIDGPAAKRTGTKTVQAPKKKPAAGRARDSR